MNSHFVLHGYSRMRMKIAEQLDNPPRFCCGLPSRINSEISQSFPCRLIKPTRDETIIGQQNINLLLNCLQKLKDFAESHNSDSIFAVATEGLRRAGNSTEIVDQISSTLGINFTILSGEQEATGIAQGILADPYLCNCEDFWAWISEVAVSRSFRW